MTEKELVTKMLNTLVKSRKELANIDLGITKKSLPDLDKIIEHLGAPLMIMVMGEFSTGKSTFINAMVGEEVAAVNATPTTAVITKLCYGEEDKICVHFTDGTEKEYKKTAFKRLTSKTGKKNEDKTHESIEYVERQLPLDMLQYVTIIDSPGLNDINEQNSDTTKKFINNADTMFFMFSALKPVSKTEIDAMESLTPRLKPIAIINKMDAFDEEEENKGQEEFLDDIRVKLKDKVQAVVGISAKYALEGKLERNETKAEIGNLKELEQVVRDLVLPNRDKFKLNTLMDELGEWIDLTATELKELDDINQKNKEVIYEDYLSLKSRIQQNREILSNIIIEIKEYVSDEAKKYNEQALYLLGIFFDQGIVFGKDDEQAEQYLESAALKNHIGAQAALGGVYWTKKDIKKAKFWLEKAAKQNDKIALFALGAIYLANEETGEFDNNQKPDYKKAASLFEKAASMNEPNSLFSLYLMYCNGMGVEENEEKAMGFLVRAAKLGHESALNALGKGLISDIENNYSTETIVEAMDCFSRAEEYGHADAIFNLGEVYRRFGKDEIRDQESLHYYKKAALLGNSDAQYWLAKYYGNGVGLEKDKEQAFVWYTKSAEQENAEAQNMLGRCYEEGWGVEKDSCKAAEWYKKAAEQGDKAAQYNLAICYDEGKGVKQNQEQAAIWYQKAAEQGEKNAQFNLGICYFNGSGIEKDYEQAVLWFRKAAEQGLANAQDWLGFCYQNGYGTKQDSKQAFNWFKPAAEQGSASAQYNLGSCYEHAYGVLQDDEQAVYWYQKAAEQGNESAKQALSRLQNRKNNKTNNNKEVCTEEWDEELLQEVFPSYVAEKGNAIGKNEKFSELYKLLARAEQGNVEAQYRLGLCYKNGDGTAKDNAKAYTWFQKAAEAGYLDAKYEYALSLGISSEAFGWFKEAAEAGHAGAQNMLGRFYAEGWVSMNDDELAFEWYLKAANQGLAVAQYNVALSCLRGRGVVEDREVACLWFKEAAKQGHADAQNMLGRCYDEGWGVIRDDKLAFEWYLKAANQGLAPAQYNVAMCCLNGRGVAQNRETACLWFKEAAKQNHEFAKKALREHFDIFM